MTSPFPGMNPYLEGDLWPDVHNAIISKIRQLIVPKISPKYVARIQRYVVEDDNTQGELGVMYPDVEILKNKSWKESATQYGNTSKASPASISIPVTPIIPVKIPFIEIKDAKNNLVITLIEVLSPVNKRSPGLQPYLEKKRKSHAAGVHFMEIDLLRRGKRTVQHPSFSPTDYLIALTKGHAKKTDIWSIPLPNRLPIIPVPLAEVNEFVVLDMQKALDQIFEEAAYGLSINYTEAPPPPKLSPENQEWLKTLKLTNT